MTQDEAREIRRGDPAVYTGSHDEHEPIPVRWWGHAQAGYARALVGPQLLHTPVEYLRHPTPEELLVLEWPSLEGGAT